MRFICLLFGHKWHVAPSASFLWKYGAPGWYECGRCWELRKVPERAGVKKCPGDYMVICERLTDDPMESHKELVGRTECHRFGGRAYHYCFGAELLDFDNRLGSSIAENWRHGGLV